MADNKAFDNDLGEQSTSFSNVESKEEPVKDTDFSNNGFSTIKIDDLLEKQEIPKPYAGMPKEVLLHYSRKKHFVWARNIMTAAVILTILTLLSLVIALIAISPGCQEFWQTSPIYQIYPKSYADSNNDGIGDITGIRGKLDYLKDDLGVEMVWLNPVYESPQFDNGYDIMDYRSIDPVFGTMNDMEYLITDLHDRGMKLIMDFVPNHTSDQHAWFNASSDPDHAQHDKYRDYYIWVDSKDGTENGKPNNWQSVFSDVEKSAWEWNAKRKQFYYHAFLKQQPDLNFRNEAVLAELDGVLAFWMDQGVDGFRCDAVGFMFEATHLRDNPLVDPTLNRSFKCLNCLAQGHNRLTCGQFRSSKPTAEGRRTYSTRYSSGEFYKQTLIASYTNVYPDYTEDQKGIHDVMARWRALLDKYSTEPGVYRFMETEVYDDVDSVIRYYGTPWVDEADFPMNFRLIDLEHASAWTGTAIETTVLEWMTKMPAGKWPNWVIGNHDQPRVVSRLGKPLAICAAFLTMTLSGTPGMYYGEEIGMEDLPIPNPQDFRDPVRTPMQWDTTENAGFCKNCTPWLPLNQNYASGLNVEDEKVDPTSVFNIYKRLINLRSQDTFLRGYLCMVYSSAKSVVYVRELPGAVSYLIAINFGDSLETIDLRSAYSFLPGAGTLYLSTTNQAITAIPFNSVTIQAKEGLAIQFKPGGNLFNKQANMAGKCFTSKKVCLNGIGILQHC